MWKAFQRYRQLDPESRKLFWRAVTLLPAVSRCLHTRGFQRTRENLAKKLAGGNPVAHGATAETLQKTCRMVKAAAYYGFGHPTCLEQSLVLWYLLQERNISTILRIGVRKSAEKFEAHAWVEHDGVPLNQSEEVHQHYAAFESAFAGLPGENA
jgi:Transglutaminase-like superfamily